MTANHPFWSLDRLEFVQVGELAIGERLQTLAGDVKWVQQKLPRPGPTPVYNLEVQDEHVYYVGASGVLAHNAGRNCGGGSGRGLTVYDPAFAARQTLKKGRFHVDDLKKLVPSGVPDTFSPTTTIQSGSKFKYVVNGTGVEIKWHSPDATAAQKFPGSRSGAMWTAQIRIGNKLLGSDGRLYRKPSDLTHIPIDF